MNNVISIIVKSIIRKYEKEVNNYHNNINIDYCEVLCHEIDCEIIQLFLFLFLTLQTESCLFLASSFYEHHWSPEQPCPFPVTHWYVPDHRILHIYPSPGVMDKHITLSDIIRRKFICHIKAIAVELMNYFQERKSRLIKSNHFS